MVFSAVSETQGKRFGAFILIQLTDISPICMGAQLLEKSEKSFLAILGLSFLPFLLHQGLDPEPRNQSSNNLPQVSL